MPDLTLRLDGAAVVLNIRGRAFTLTAPRSEFTTAGSGSGPNPNRGGRIRLEYHESYEDAVDLGTPEDVLREVESLLNSVPASPPLADRWASVRTELRQVPILNQVAQDVLSTNVRITDIAIELTKVAGQDRFSGSFTLGLMFTPTTRPRLFRAELVAFGGVVTIALEGSVSELGFTWPS